MARELALDVKLEVFEDDVRAGCSIEDVNDLRFGVVFFGERDVRKEEREVASSMADSFDDLVPIVLLDSQPIGGLKSSDRSMVYEGSED